jgi:hypothetical protein
LVLPRLLFVSEVHLVDLQLEVVGQLVLDGEEAACCSFKGTDILGIHGYGNELLDFLFCEGGLRVLVLQFVEGSNGEKVDLVDELLVALLL